MKQIIAIVIGLAISNTAQADEGAAFVTNAQTKAVQAFRQMPVPESFSGRRSGLIAIALWAQRGNCAVLVTDRHQAWWLNDKNTTYRIWFKDEDRGDYYGVAASLPPIEFGPEAASIIEIAQTKFCR